jgi:enamine deaminase RidA (YjgF/YER057c/UK114 family)
MSRSTNLSFRYGWVRGENEVYREYFRENPPARYYIRANLVRPEFLVEIASVAHLEQ